MNRAVIFGVAGVLAVALVAVLVTGRPEPAPAETTVESVPAAPAPAAPPAAAPTAPSAPRGVRTVPPPTAAPAEPTAPGVEAPPPAADMATLRIDSDVPGAQVFLDRQFVGTAPVTAENVKPGSHTLNVSAEGFEGIAQTIDVTPGPRDITVRFREVRLDARLAVVHGHRMGSCRGELIATPQGIRYETTNRDDAFTVAMADLETFQVDYLEKNLRVKIRRGRQFNFTDPDGNADRLFVFHRDVDKAKTRLGRGDTAAQ
jgi:hypothetical protein